MLQKINNLGKKTIRGLVFTHDVIMIVAAWLLAYFMRANLVGDYSFQLNYALHALPVVLVIQTMACYAFGLYRGVWRFASIPDLVRIIKVVFVGILISALVLFFMNRLQGIPRSIFLLYGMILILLFSGPRIFYRWIKNRGYFLSNAKRVLVVGAGQAGEGFVRDAQRTQHDYQVVAFVDDDTSKLRCDIHGISVKGRISDIPQLVNIYNVDLIVIAIPSANSVTMRKIVDVCESTNVPIQTLPGIKDITSGRVNINSLREIFLEDLLGREPVALAWDAIEAIVCGKKVMVTGGAGSIGSELCRQIAMLAPSFLIVIDNGEFNLYELEMELKKNFPNLSFTALLVSVTDRAAIKSIMQQYRPHIVFHAAAYKHVPILEQQVRAAIVNNLLGTATVAEEAIQSNVEKFVLISTDKAVNPTSIMGATKRAAEVFCQDLNRHGTTQFITTRFGNVLGSRGSVIPLFKKQLEQGGPLTVTHPDITRYFMTIPEAVQLILQTTVMGTGGEIFVLDMGEPIKIRYLAEQVIRLAGKIPDQDIKIIYTGLRPGEKLHEELFYENEKFIDTQHKKVHRAISQTINSDELANIVEKIKASVNEADTIQLQELLLKLVPEYLGGNANQ